MTIARFPIEKCTSPSGEYHCSKHPQCKGPSLPRDHSGFCDLGEQCDTHWEPCEFCAAVETLDAMRCSGGMILYHLSGPCPHCGATEDDDCAFGNRAALSQDQRDKS